jgi:sulfite reductase (NADPH) flavoprotein alpha-component
MSEAGSQISRSSSATLYPSFTPALKKAVAPHSAFGNPNVPASSVIEYVASRPEQSSAVYVFDLAEQVGFGTLTKEWAKSAKGSTSPVIPLQTRAGAGLSLVGRLSEGTSEETVKGAVLTAYASLNGLSLMAPALSYLPPASVSSRLVIQVPVLAPVGDNQSLVPSTAPLATLLQILPSNVAVLLSATPQEAVDFAQLAYKLKSSHVIHLFDQHSAAREIGQTFTELPKDAEAVEDVSALLKSAGYSGISYSGDANAETVLVLLNGPLALLARAFVEQTPGLGLVIISVLRPLDDAAVREVIPSSAKTVHVVDEVPNTSTQGPLFADVFGSLIGLATKTRSRRILPTDVHSFISDATAFATFIQGFAPQAQPVAVPASGKKILLLGAPKTPLASVPYTIENVFSSAPNIASRLVTDYDVFSKAGGISASRILLSSKTSKSSIPITFTIPWKDEALDYTVVYDQNLLKSHEIVKYAKPGSAILVLTTWTPAELLANMPRDTPATIAEKNLHLYSVDVKAVAVDVTGATAGNLSEAVQAIAAHLAFLRLYLGRNATEQSVLTVARGGGTAEDSSIDLDKIGAKTWEALVEIELPTSILADEDGIAGSPLKSFDFNAVAVETDEGDVVNGAFLGSWHDAAKHLILPSHWHAALTPSLVSHRSWRHFFWNRASKTQ